MKRQLLAISGGGFSEQVNAAIDDYLIQLVQKDTPIKIAFLATASHDHAAYIEKFYAAFSKHEATHITELQFYEADIKQRLYTQDIVYIGGGNTKFMLDAWKKAGFDEVIKTAYARGVIFAGISAGAMCLFEHCYSEVDGRYVAFEGLGLLKGAFCPHYQEPKRQQAFDAWATQNAITPCYTLTDNENLYFQNEYCKMKLTSY